jgi:hypothetical protein
MVLERRKSYGARHRSQVRHLVLANLPKPSPSTPRPRISNRMGFAPPRETQELLTLSCRKWWRSRVNAPHAHGQLVCRPIGPMSERAVAEVASGDR